MLKKIISVVLALSLALSCSVFFASAKAEANVPDVDDFVGAIKDDVSGMKKAFSKIGELSKSLVKNLEPYVRDVFLTPENIEKATDLGVKAMIKVIDKITNPGTPGEPSEPGQPSDPSDPSQPSEPSQPTDSITQILVDELKVVLKKYIFVKVDDVDEATINAMETSNIRYELVTDDNGTVYIMVDIEANPGIFNYAVFRNVVDELYAAQNEELIKNSDGQTDYAMSYEHIAGELALHAAIYAVTNEIIDVTDTNSSLILRLYKSAAQADLNFDEARVPSEVISIMGVVLVDLFQFNLLKLFGVIK